MEDDEKHPERGGSAARKAMERVREFSDHELFGLLRDQDAEAWRTVWEEAVLAEASTAKNAQMMRKWGVEAEELMCELYAEMIGKGRIANYRDDGGSIIGFLRAYVRGYIYRRDPAKRREVPVSAFEKDGEAEENIEEKIAMDLSDLASRNALPHEEASRREDWEEVQACFAELWRKSPLKAYVHLMKLKMRLSSEQIRKMLSISSAANVDQMFSRAVREMRELRDGKK